MKTQAKLVFTLLSAILLTNTACSHSATLDRTTSQANTAERYSGASQYEFSQAQLDAMLAPVALYPDTVLSHVLIAATYPLEVVEADRWISSHKNLKGDAAVAAVDNQDWDPSVKALVAFPDILQRMSRDLDWTQQLGDAFLASEERVMDSIQNLRNRAYDSGTLDKVEHVRVVRETKTIVIEPSVERVVYVPVYDTRVVYGDWWWPDYPPVYWHSPSNYVLVSGLYWGPRVYLGPRFYFSAFHWHNRRVVVVDHHHHHTRFYDSRSIVRHQSARHWHHNPVHRRGVAYHDERIRARYNSPRESYSNARVYRDNVRDSAHNSARNSSPIAPNRARELRQHNTERAGGMGNTLRTTQPSTHASTRADDVRARLNERVPSNRPATNNRPSTEGTANRAERISPTRIDRTTPRPPPRTTDSTAARPSLPAQQQDHRLYGTDRLGAKRVETNRTDTQRTATTQRTTTTQRIDNRAEQTRAERVERAPSRMERSPASMERSRSTERPNLHNSNARNPSESRGPSRDSTR